MPNISVSVIIPVFNGELLIRRCLESVFNQNRSLTLDVIVIDDGSTDNSVDLVIGLNYPIRLFRQTNMGPATARNKGIEEAKGKYIAFLDADDYWLPDFLQMTVCFLEKNQSAVAVNVAQLIKAKGKPEEVSPQIISSESKNYTRALLLPNFFDFWATHNHVCTGSVLLRSEVVRLSGGLRPELRITEDLEFWLYIATFGQWGFIPKVLFVGDGGIVTKKIGWIKKNKKRWASAPCIPTWEKRIVERIPKPLPYGYLYARGRIASILAYSMILSGRYQLARKTVLEYRKHFPENKLTSLLKSASFCTPCWYFICLLLRLRELFRIV